MTRKRSERHDVEGVVLDLGLGDILSSPPPPAAPVEEAPAAPSEAAAPAESHSPFEILAAQGDWAAVARLAEGRLPATGTQFESLDTIEARIWWIAAQEAIASVPRTILVSPLESAASMLCERWKELLREDAQVHERLEKLALLLMKLLRTFAKDFEITGETHLGALCAERARELEGLSSGTPFERFAERSEVSSGGSGVVLSDDFIEKSADALPGNKSLGESNGAAPVPGEPISSTKRATSVRSAIWLFALLIVVALWSAVLARHFASDSSENQQNERLALSYSEDFAKPALILPTAPRLDQVSQLDAVFYDVANNPGGVAALKEAAQRARVEQGQAISAKSAVLPPVSSSSVVAAASIGGHDNQGQTPKETVDTSGPVESHDFPRVESYDRGREVGPRDAGLQEDSRHDRPEPSRGAIEPPRFEQFTPTRFYRTLVRTQVMSEPSLKGRAVDTLERGVEVEAEGREGYWLRLRSAHGNLGFILAQDAERERDW